ncbi:MAG: signal peptidase I [Holophagaceae bacterium]|jgi:signal peptidase I|nr:signal peptidase I [Holophagaceae bacterium]
MKLKTYISASLLALAPFAFLHPVKVRGGSMEPTLQNGQVLLALWPWCSGTPALGEVRILNTPEGTVIKRILAMPGQELEQRNGYLIRSGQIVEEPYISFRETKNDGRWYAQDGYMLLGDNRPQSLDCRIWGPIDKNRIGGRVLIR